MGREEMNAALTAHFVPALHQRGFKGSLFHLEPAGGAWIVNCPGRNMHIEYPNRPRVSLSVSGNSAHSFGSVESTLRKLDTVIKRMSGSRQECKSG